MAHGPANPLPWALAAFKQSTQADRYRLYGRYYRGDQDLAFATDKFRSTFGQLFATFSYNRCSVVVDSVADRLSIESFTSDKGDAVSNKAMEIWDANRMDVRAGEVHKEAMRSGDGYVIVWPEMAPDGSIMPTIWPQTAEQIRVHYDDEKPGEITLAAKTWPLHDGRIRLNLYFRDRIEKHVTRNRATNGLPTQETGFEEFHVKDAAGQDEPWPITNEWDVVPVFHFANNADIGSYGQSELRDVVPLQNALNKTLSDMMVAMELAAYPQRILLGIEEEDKDRALAALRTLEGGIAKIITVGSGDAKVAEFSAAQLSQFTDVAEFWDKAISRTSRLPVHLLQMSGDFPSGVAERMAENPYTHKIEDRQISFTPEWGEVQALALRQAGVADPGNIEVIWTPAAPISDEEKWALAVTQKSAGLPLDEILKLAGYSPEDIAAINEVKQASAAQFAQQAQAQFNAGTLATD